MLNTSLCLTIYVLLPLETGDCYYNIVPCGIIYSRSIAATSTEETFGSIRFIVGTTFSVMSSTGLIFNHTIAYYPTLLWNQDIIFLSSFCAILKGHLFPTLLNSWSIHFSISVKPDIDSQRFELFKRKALYKYLLFY